MDTDNKNEGIFQNYFISPTTKDQINSDIFINNNNSLNKSFSTEKKYLNFSSEKDSNIKNFNLNQLLELDTDLKKQKYINNDIIYNEIINNLNDIINKTQMEYSRAENFYLAKNNLYSNLKYFLSDITNFDEERASILNKDFDNIKYKFDYYINNIGKISQIDLEILNDSIKNYNDYCMLFLKKIKNINNIKELAQLLQIYIKQIIFNYIHKKNKQKNILLSNHKTKNFLNNKRKLSQNNNDINKDINKENNVEIKNNMIIISKDEKGIFNQYIYYKYKADDIKNIYTKNLIPKYIDLSIYISKNENEDYIMQIISNIKCMFKKYVITYKNNKDEAYMKIKFCGINSKPKCIIKKVKYLMKNLLNEKSLVKINLFSNLKDCLYKVINQINMINDNNIDKSSYDYFTTNINYQYLKQLIYN